MFNLQYFIDLVHCLLQAQQRFLKLKTFVQCFTFLERTHKADTPSEGQPTFCKKHCVVQTARNLLHLADIEQQKAWKKTCMLHWILHRLRGLSQETLMLQNLLSKYLILKCSSILAALLLSLFSQAPNKRPCQFKRFRRANKIAASMAGPWQMARVLKWSRYIPMHSLGGSKQ